MPASNNPIINFLTRVSKIEASEAKAVLSSFLFVVGFKRLFAADNVAVRLMRNMGLGKVNRIKPLKNEIIKQVMGL